MEHENRYGDLINELISIFIPPENATAAQLEEARKNMEKYADYRTYLSFDMQQLIKNEDEVIRIGLSRMIRKIPAVRDRTRYMWRSLQVLHRPIILTCHQL